MQLHVDELERPREDGLTVQDLFESHATYVELRIDYDCNAPGLLELYARHHVEPPYRKAYDYAREQLGDEMAFDLFPVFVFLALCSSDPVLSFVRLVERTRSLAGEGDGGELTLPLESLIHYCCGYVYLGSPIDWPVQPELDAYRRSLGAVRSMRTSGEFDTYAFFQDPMETLTRWIQSDTTRSKILPAMVYEPEASGRRTLAILGGGEESFRSTAWALCQAAAFRMIFNSLDPFEPARVEQVQEDERSLALKAARRGQNVDALFNLGQIAQRRGQQLAARVWWRQAAADGDPGAMKALGIAHSQSGEVENGEYWGSPGIDVGETECHRRS